MKKIILHRTEKNVSLLNSQRTFIVQVPIGVNKATIKALVEADFEIKVDKVRTLNQRGKTKFYRGVVFGKRVKTLYPGRRPNFKKAYIVLSPEEDLKTAAAKIGFETEDIEEKK